LLEFPSNFLTNYIRISESLQITFKQSYKRTGKPASYELNLVRVPFLKPYKNIKFRKKNKEFKKFL
jgi:hypothetical protein